MSDFRLFLFATEPWVVRAATEGGVDGFVVDWEQRGKHDRQAGRDTEVNADTAEDLDRVRAATTAPVLCRVNSFGPGTPEEVEAAISGGTDEILLPMVTGADEVQAVIEAVGGRCGVGVLVETVAAVEAVEELALLPLSRVYVGLNDLSIDRGTAACSTRSPTGRWSASSRRSMCPSASGCSPSPSSETRSRAAC